VGSRHSKPTHAKSNHNDCRDQNLQSATKCNEAGQLAGDGKSVDPGETLNLPDSKFSTTIPLQDTDVRGTAARHSHSTTGSPMIADSHPDLVSELHQQLEGKNELIAALVAELEQVVEQLDRVKRNGNDRGRTGGSSAALPAEVVEEHQQVLGELQRVVQQWEQMQAGLALGRIESELAELRSMIGRGGNLGSTSDSLGRGESNDRDSVEAVLSRLSMTPPAEDSSMLTLSGTDWEAMKRQMAGDSADDSDDVAEDDLTKLLDGIAVPVPVDFDNATVDELKRACAERDTYIVQVTRWIRTRRAVTVPENWDEIPGVPEEMQKRVEALAQRLEEQVRLAEVEMSLERARLSREKSQVQADRAVMDKHMKRLGITSMDELDEIAVSSTSSGERRWMRFLGVNRKS
jgi:hypothetical protein